MNRDLETLEYRQLPQFLVQAQQILEVFAGMSREQLKEFARLGYQFCEASSTENKYVFII